MKYLYLLPNSFSYPSTLTLALLRTGRPVRYVSIKANERTGKSNIRFFKDGTRFFLIIIRIATLFSPFRVFFPTSLLFFILGLSNYIYTFIVKHSFTNMSMLLFMTCLLIFMLGLVAEQIAQMRLDRTEEEVAAATHSSAYLYKGFFRIPSYALSQPYEEGFYPRLYAAGASARGQIGSAVVAFEAGIYDSRDDKDGDSPFIPNSEVRALTGIQAQPFQDMTIGFQYFSQLMLDYGSYKESVSGGLTAENEIEHTVTFRVTWLLLYQTLRLGFFSFLDPVHGDMYLIPSARYSIADGIQVEGGANIFEGGSKTLGFDALDGNDNIFATIRYEF